MRNLSLNAYILICYLFILTFLLCKFVYMYVIIQYLISKKWLGCAFWKTLANVFKINRNHFFFCCCCFAWNIFELSLIKFGYLKLTFFPFCIILFLIETCFLICFDLLEFFKSFPSLVHNDVMCIYRVRQKYPFPTI